jgi:hypothetical protein
MGLVVIGPGHSPVMGGDPAKTLNVDSAQTLFVFLRRDPRHRLGAIKGDVAFGQLLGHIRASREPPSCGGEPGGCLG